ncbi:MAG: hypothetical protein KAS12_02250 [Candidatus Aenigmarchaeota archaeon]|nr:hypothetical protein [Candidatus Aenigmarchaeota archaeon]
MIYTQSNSRVIRRILSDYAKYVFDMELDLVNGFTNRVCWDYITDVVYEMHYGRVLDIHLKPEHNIDKKTGYEILKGCYEHCKENIANFNKIRMEHITDEKVIWIAKKFCQRLRLSRYLNIPFDTEKGWEKKGRKLDKLLRKQDYDEMLRS